jgi:2-[(L-alanin-3-ylcarbamoyl)methyl]-2-hydroxybutanedioate decarboxylase
MILTEQIKTAIKSRYDKSHGRSFYLYDTAIMQSKIKHLRSIMPPQVQLFYAMKANPHTAFLSCALGAGVTGVEIASLGEGKISLSTGFKPEQIIFTGPGKSPEELEWSVKTGIRTVHIESLTEAYRLNAIAQKHGRVQDILIRLNPDFDIHDAQAHFSGGSKKMGIDTEKLDEYLPRILALPHLRFRGLHVYAASGVLRVEDLLTNCTLVFKIAKHIEQSFKPLRCDIIDFGGGFGIDYLESGRDFSPEDYVEQLKLLIEEYSFSDRSFVLELGRYLTADSGWYCTEILDIKDSRGTKQVITAGGTNHFRRPAALSINHPVVVIPMNRAPIFDDQESVEKEKVYIGGPLCNSADKIANQVYLDEAHIGDIVVLCLAGAYGLTMSHTDFLSHAKPEEMVLSS